MLKLFSLLVATLMTLSCGQAAHPLNSVQVLHVFATNPLAPRFPGNRLAESSNQELYGTTVLGGPSDSGTLFKISKTGGFTVLHTFDVTNGAGPAAGVIRGSDGYFYGTTVAGGEFSGGTLFRFSTGGVLSILHSFPNGSFVLSPVTQVGDGDLYGVTSRGGLAVGGTIFRFRAGGMFETLHEFAPSGNVGIEPRERLVPGADGWFYSTTVFGAENDHGTIFRFGSSNVLQPVFAFAAGTRTDGELLLGADSAFYGVTSSGGAFGYGTIFRISTNGALTTLVHFDGTNGASPAGGLMQSREGYFYGTTLSGPAGGATIFRLTTNGLLTTLCQLAGTNAARPYASMLQATDGALYGAFANNGAPNPSNGGLIVRIDEQPTIDSIARNGGESVLTWRSFLNRIYRIEFATSTSAPAWMPLGHEVLSQGNVTSFSVPLDLNQQRFYRVVLLP